MPKSFTDRVSGQTITDVSDQLRLSELMIVNMFPAKFKAGQVDELCTLRDLGPRESVIRGDVLSGPLLVFQTDKHVQGTAHASRCCSNHETVCTMTLANMSRDQVVQLLQLLKSWDRPEEPQGQAPASRPGQPGEGEDTIG
jgi:hypothetical protein